MQKIKTQTDPFCIFFFDLSFLIHIQRYEFQKARPNTKRIQAHFVHLFIALGIILLLLLSLCGCSSSSPSPSSSIPKGEYIFRKQNESFVKVEPMVQVQQPLYPWQEERKCSHPKITKEFFRCKGNILNPVRFMQRGQETVRFYDCGGGEKHSLPVREGKEFIYPILIHLLNDIQDKTGKKIIITCGHCCPDHNAYLDPSIANQASKHMLGAEVDFYVQDMEYQPDKIVEMILSYYKEQPRYKGLKDFQEFKRFEKTERNSKITPWYNKEIFVKIISKEEGRDCDNQHPYPYVSIQVRYDFDKKEAVTYSWDKAFRSFWRW